MWVQGTGRGKGGGVQLATATVSTTVYTCRTTHCGIGIYPTVLTRNRGYGVVHTCGVGGCGCGMPPDHPWCHPCYALGGLVCACPSAPGSGIKGWHEGGGCQDSTMPTTTELMVAVVAAHASLATLMQQQAEAKDQEEKEAKEVKVGG